MVLSLAVYWIGALRVQSVHNKKSMLHKNAHMISDCLLFEADRRRMFDAEGENRHYVRNIVDKR